jgi:uncharacterized protein (DUF486 family)
MSQSQNSAIFYKIEKKLMSMSVGELVKECEKETNWKTSLKKPKKLFHSFTGDFECYRKNIENNLEKEEIEKFIEICDIRVEWAKTLMKEVGTVFSFGITIISFAFAVTSVILTKKNFDVFNIRFDGQIVTIILFVVFLAFLLFGILRLHYRHQIHAWTAFKEAVILNENYSKKGN